MVNTEYYRSGLAVDVDFQGSLARCLKRLKYSPMGNINIYRLDWQYKTIFIMIHLIMWTFIKNKNK